MVDDKEPKQTNEQHDTQKIQRVENLYKMADEVYGGFGEASPARPRMVSVADAAQARTDSEGLAKLPRWVQHALTDLANYAENDDLKLLHDCLRQAEARAKEILDIMEIHIAARGSDESDS